MSDRDRLALATARAFHDLSADDRLLIAPLQRRGFDPRPVVWDDPAIEWGAFAGVVVRSCWDYHTRHDEFLAWVERLETLGVPMWNPPPLVRWNSDKRYLLDLARRGVRIVPTVLSPRGVPATLARLMADNGWTRAVIKPAVSASAHETWIASANTAGELQRRFDLMLGRGNVLVQPFIREIADDGEWSLIFLGGAYSHAVLKRPAEGDFRVQSEHGGSAERREPTAATVSAAASVLRAVPTAQRPVYARVDGYVDAGGDFVLMELELIEPLLYLAEEASAADRLADAVLASGARP